MTLILFDIDGTLTATSTADNGSFERAFNTVFEIPLPTTDWSQYKHVTDMGIVREVIEPHRPVTQEEADRFEDAYLTQLKESCARNPVGFSQVPGSAAILAEITSLHRATASLATGGFRRTATFKLSRIGIDAASIPGAYANDAISRADIARLSIARANMNADRTVYVGDGLWDAYTSHELGIPFVGIAHESSAEGLRAAGASHVIQDFQDTAAFFDAIANARVPSPRVS